MYTHYAFQRQQELIRRERLDAIREKSKCYKQDLSLTLETQIAWNVFFITFQVKLNICNQNNQLLFSGAPSSMQ